MQGSKVRIAVVRKSEMDFSHTLGKGGECDKKSSQRVTAIASENVKSAFLYHAAAYDIRFFSKACFPPETNQTVETEQCWCGLRDRLVGPLALGFNSEVGAHPLKSDLHFPSLCEIRDDFGWIHIGVGAEERLWFHFPIRIAHQHPSE